MQRKKKIAVFGLGHVGLHLSTLLSKFHTVYSVDINPALLRRLANSPCTGDITFCTPDKITAYYQQLDFVIIAVPTDYSPSENRLDTSAVEGVVREAVSYNSRIGIVIRSTVPVGFTSSLASRYPYCPIIYSPEFLREGYELHDNYHPSRIVIGTKDASESSLSFADSYLALLRTFITEFPAVKYMSFTEAELVKLASNAYLAMRVAFFNEIDSYALCAGLDMAKIIDAVSSDPRIGNYYNRPSFGFGGYCLPKDTAQLSQNMRQYAEGENLADAVIASNTRRRELIISQIIERLRSLPVEQQTVGFYRLVSKRAGTDTWHSVSRCLAEALCRMGVSVTVFEPLLSATVSEPFALATSLAELKNRCAVIVADNVNDDLADVTDRVFSRDISHMEGGSSACGSV